MTTQPTHLYFDQALREEYRRHENIHEQLKNVLLGIGRFAATLWMHTFALTAVFILLALCVTPQTLLPLMVSAPYNAEQIASPVPPYLAGEGDTDEPGPVLYQQPAPLDAAPMSVGEAQLRAKNGASLEAAQQQTSIQYPTSRDGGTQAREEAISLLKNVLRIATLCAFIVGVICNTGRFRWVYRDRAWARVHAAEQLRERLALCQQAAASALAQQQGAAQDKGQEAV